MSKKIDLLIDQSAWQFYEFVDRQRIEVDNMELLYKVKDRPALPKLIIFAIQQFLAIVAGTVTLPLVVGNGMSQSAALLGASVGTLLYLLITKFRSPVFLGSSFTYLGSMASAFAGAATAAIGYLGILIGAFLAGLVYVVLSITIRFTGVRWVNKIMTPTIVGPTVAIIALTLAPNAILNFSLGGVVINESIVANPYLCMGIGFITLIAVIVFSIYGKGLIKLIPLVLGLTVGFIVALIFTWIGNGTGNTALMIVDFSAFDNIKWVPDFTFFHAIDGIKDFKSTGEFFKYFGLIAITYVPVALAVFAEHIADHKNISHIIETDLLADPGLSRTLMGDGLGSMVGAFFGGCPNTTYGESISCLAFSKNASIITIVVTSLIGIGISFIGPLMAVLSMIPPCVIGGVSVCLYGYIALSGFQMLKKVNLNEQKNIFVVAVIFVFGIGGFTISFQHFEFPTVACAMVAGLLVNLLVNIKPHQKLKKKTHEVVEETKETEQSNS